MMEGPYLELLSKKPNKIFSTSCLRSKKRASYARRVSATTSSAAIARRTPDPDRLDPQPCKTLINKIGADLDLGWFRVWVSGFRVQGVGFRVEVSGLRSEACTLNLEGCGNAHRNASYVAEALRGKKAEMHPQGSEPDPCHR